MSDVRRDRPRGTPLPAWGQLRAWLAESEGLPAGSELVRRLIAPVLLAGLGVGTKALLEGAGLNPSFVTYFLVVTLSAWVGGLRAGLLTTAVALVGDTVLFATVPAPDSPAGQVRFLLFAADGLLASVITSALRRNATAAIAARALAQGRAREASELLQRREAALAEAVRDREGLERLQAVTASLSAAATPREVAEAVLDRGLPAVGARAAGVTRLARDRSTLELIAARGYPADVVAQNVSFPAQAGTHLGDAVHLARPVYLPDRASWVRHYPDAPPRRLDGDDPATDQAFAAVPLVAWGRVIGVLALRFDGRRDFAGGQGALIERLAGQCALALDRAIAAEDERNAHDALVRAQARSAFLAEAARLLNGTDDVERALAAVAAAAVPAIADGCLIELSELDGPPLIALAHRDPERARQLRELAGRVSVPSAQAVAGNGAGRVAAGAGRIAGSVIDRSDPLGLPGSRSVVSARVGQDDGRSGFLAFVDARPDHFGPEDRTLAEDLAGRITTVLGQARLFRDVRRFKATVDATLDAVVMFDPHSLRITYANEGAVAQLGYSRTELLAMTAPALAQDEDEGSLHARVAPLLAGRESGETYTTLQRRKDGRAVPVEVFLQCVNLPAGPPTMIATSRNISDRIEVQAQLARIARDERARAAELRAIIEGLGDGVLVFDGAGTTLLVNEAARALIGGEVGHHDDVAARLRVAPDRMPGLGAAVGPIAVATEDDRWLELTTHPAHLSDDGLVADEGSAASTILLVRDITRAREIERAREAFGGVLSHELRTPVTTIYGNAKLLRRPATRRNPEVADGLLDDIEAESGRLYRIVEDLLALSKFEGGVEVDGEPLLLQHVIEAVVAAEQARWPAVRFRLEIARRLPTAFGDRTYVEQVLRNLLSNAGKYSDPGTEVTVIAEPTEREIIARVLDQGVGIKDEEADRLFQLYYRSPGTARQASGAGIGLYVSRGLVEAMGGRIWARRRPEGGSEFGFSLPRLADPDT